jgi:hypothetical protein
MLSALDIKVEIISEMSYCNPVLPLLIAAEDLVPSSINRRMVLLVILVEM